MSLSLGRNILTLWPRTRWWVDLWSAGSDFSQMLRKWGFEESPVVGILLGCRCQIPLQQFLGCRRVWCSEQTWLPGWWWGGLRCSQPWCGLLAFSAFIVGLQGHLWGSELKFHCASSSLPSGIHTFSLALLFQPPHNAHTSAKEVKLWGHSELWPQTGTRC